MTLELARQLFPNLSDEVLIQMFNIGSGADAPTATGPEESAELQAVRDLLVPEAASSLSSQFLLQALQASGGNAEAAAQFINQQFQDAAFEALQTQVSQIPGLGGGGGDDPANAFLAPFLAAGLSPDQAQEALLASLGVGGGGDQGITDFQQAQLDFQLRQFNAQQSQQGISQAMQAAGIALQEGNFELALQQFEAANFLGSEASGRANLATAGNLQQQQAQTIQGAAGIDIAAGSLLGNLVNTIGQLGVEQQRLGLDLLRTPRNATAAFLLGLGTEDPVAFPQFDVSNILGIDVGQIQGLIDSVVEAAGSARTRAGESTEISLNDLLSALETEASRVRTGLGEAVDGEEPEVEETTMTAPSGGDNVVVTPGQNAIIDQILAPAPGPFFSPAGGAVIPGGAGTGAPDPFDTGGFDLDPVVTPSGPEPEEDIESFLDFLLGGGA